MILRASLSLLAIGCAGLPPIDTAQVIVYSEREHGIFEVFDVATGIRSYGGSEVLEAPPGSGEFGGPTLSCGDPAYHCFITGLHVAVPKAGSPREWRAGRNECRVLSDSDISDDVPVRILCRPSPQIAVEFSFSRSRGIISYRGLCATCYLGEFQLISPRGLFADPAGPATTP
jgi:hypothetical protein